MTQGITVLDHWAALACTLDGYRRNHALFRRAQDGPLFRVVLHGVGEIVTLARTPAASAQRGRYYYRYGRDDITPATTQLSVYLDWVTKIVVVSVPNL